MTDQPRLASLFSGAGGFDVGFAAAGFRSVAAYDLDQIAVDNFNANVARTASKVDLTNGIPEERSLVGIDSLIAGPPCQGFSTAGKRDVDDQRNHLLTLTGKLALRIRPKVLVVENVAGALSGLHTKYWEELDSTMRNGGYKTQTVRCQARDLGMAQLRNRVLLFAWRTGVDLDLATPKAPKQTLRTVLRNVGGTKNHAPTFLAPGTSDWYIADRIRPGQKLSNVRGGRNSVATWDIPHVFGEITEAERTVLELLRRLRRQDRTREVGDADPVSHARLEKALGAKFRSLINSLLKKNYLRETSAGVDLVGTFNGKYRRLSWEGPSVTVDTRFGSPRYFLHPSQHRGFTVREAARIQGFTDTFVFTGSMADQYRLIGNAVPPPIGSFAATVAKRLLELVP